ncbi:CehA/McbA family metallohydrolase [Thermodesulfobacteriota bacterium]
MSLYEFIGNLHIHSIYSDGGGSVVEIADAAKRAGLDFICITDHAHMLDSLHLEDEGFSGNLLVMVGQEIGERYHHYLAFDLKETPPRNIPDPQKIIDHVNQEGGFGFLAHPFEKGMSFREKSVAYTWNDLSVGGYTGVCIWNFSSRWKERVKSAFHGLFHLALKKQALKGPSSETLGFWDRTCMSRKVVAIGGSDAHGSFFKWGCLKLKPFSYEFLLGTINNHILLSEKIPGDFSKAKQRVYDAMKAGRLFIAYDGLFPARGFHFYYTRDDGKVLEMGDEGEVRSGNFVIKLPREGEMRLLKNGIVEEKWRGREVTFPVKEKGIYRVEVYLRLRFFGWRPWIFSNPIYLR